MSSTLLPFLYQTRTLQRAIRGPLPTIVRALHTTSPYRYARRPSKQRDDDVVPFDFGPDQHGLAASRRRRSKAEGSTITETEQRVFDEIFGAISKRRKQLGGGPIIPDMEPRDDERWQDVAAEGGKGEQEVSRERILSMYPPALRRAAELALGLQQQQEEKQEIPEGYVPQPTNEADAEIDAELAARDEAAKKSQQEAQRAVLQFHVAEKKRVKSLMESCTTDTAVWEVLEEHAFSMVERLGIAPKTPGRTRKEEKAAKRKGAITPKQREEPPPRLSMERYGPLYSLHLIAGLQHLDRGFETPSALALNILPRVLELGMASYVLGVSTRFYNELMSIYWYRYGDAASVTRLLKEMGRAGLAPDGQTLKVIEAIMVAIKGFSPEEGEKNPFGEVLATMKDYDSVAYAQLLEARRKVLASMEESASELPT